MRIKSALSALLERTLYESLNFDLMQRVARDIIQDYNLHERTGFPPNIPVPNRDAAHHVLSDMIAENRIIELIERLIHLDREGFMGRAYPVPRLREIVKAICAEGYVYDPHAGAFFEDAAVRSTPNWGRLRIGEERTIAVLRLDIADNSRIVRERGQKAAVKAYDALRRLVTTNVERRGGRVWGWEGDGAIAAFLFNHPTTQAVLAGIATLHDLFLFNRFDNELGRPLDIRAAVHVGPVVFSDALDQLAKQETIRETIEVESKHALVGTLAITPGVAPTLDRVLLELFVIGKGGQSSAIRRYGPIVGAP